jgi:3'-phosphoadenosine 5'-phosphosulfate sulfotransferase (PAPS reductase)/FAD synthetase
MTSAELQLLQALPLEDKIKKSQVRIREWYEHWCGQVYVSFSGGKDSTVLLHIVRSMYPDVPAVFADTGLEYPEIREFVMKHENVTVVRPKMNFKQVIEKYGYPVISKDQARFIEEIRGTKSGRLRDIHLHGPLLPNGTRGTFGKLSKKWKYLINAPFKISAKCCHFIKKAPMRIYERESGKRTMTGEIAAESRRRKTVYMMFGCNTFDAKHPRSMPLGFWTEQDILQSLRIFNLPYCSIYGDIIERDDGTLLTTGAERTGCIFCMFGVHLERGENRFIRLKRTHPQLWEYCIYKLGLGKVLDFINIPYESLFDSEAGA